MLLCFRPSFWPGTSGHSLFRMQRYWLVWPCSFSFSPGERRGRNWLDMLDALVRILALTRKELLAIFKDPRSRFSLFIPPILQCLIYGYVATYDLNDVPYAVLDQDRSAASQKLLAGLDGSRVFRRVANLERAADIKNMINQRRVVLVVQIDQD